MIRMLICTARPFLKTTSMFLAEDLFGTAIVERCGEFVMQNGVVVDYGLEVKARNSAVG